MTPLTHLYSYFGILHAKIRLKIAKQGYYQRDFLSAKVLLVLTLGL